MLLLPAAVALVSVDAICGPESFDFFPLGKVNQPGAWNKSSQIAAGNSEATGELFPITTYGKEAGGTRGETLQLHFQPVHPYLGTAVLSPGCLPVQSANKKRLLAASAAFMSTPASYIYTYSIDGKIIASTTTLTPGNLSSLIQIEPWALQLSNVSMAGCFRIGFRNCGPWLMHCVCLRNPSAGEKYVMDPICYDQVFCLGPLRTSTWNSSLGRAATNLYPRLTSYE